MFGTPLFPIESFCVVCVTKIQNILYVLKNPLEIVEMEIFQCDLNNTPSGLFQADKIALEYFFAPFSKKIKTLHFEKVYLTYIQTTLMYICNQNIMSTSTHQESFLWIYRSLK